MCAQNEFWIRKKVVLVGRRKPVYNPTRLTHHSKKDLSMIEDQTSQEISAESFPLVETPERNWTAWIAAGGCAILACGALFVLTLIFAGPQLKKLIPSQLITAMDQNRAQTQNNTMGDPNAPIHIIEYGDFQCPYCLQFWRETEPQLIEEYINNGTVYFEYRAFPVLGPESYSASEGAYCAGDQGKFWEYHDTLFTNWTGENVGDFTHEKLIQYADALSLDMETFEKCLSEGTHKETVLQDQAEGEAANVHATPTFFINGHMLEGSQPFEVMQHIIEELLNNGIDIGTG
jgi:protein-disulfide isomerase